MKRLYELLAVFLVVYIPLVGMKNIKIKKNILKSDFYKNISDKQSKPIASVLAKKDYFNQNKIGTKNIHLFSKYQKPTGLKNYSKYSENILNNAYFNTLLNSPTMSHNFIKIRNHSSQSSKKDAYYGKRLLAVLKKEEKNWKLLFSELAKYYHPDTTEFDKNYARLRAAELFDAKKVMNKKMSDSEYVKQWGEGSGPNQEWQKRGEEEKGRGKREQEERDGHETIRKNQNSHYKKSSSNWHYAGPKISINIRSKLLWILIGVVFYGTIIDSIVDYFVVELDTGEKIIFNKNFDYGYKQENRAFIKKRLKALKTNLLPRDISGAEKSIQSVMLTILKNKGIESRSIKKNDVMTLLYEMEDALEHGKFKPGKGSVQVCSNCKSDAALAQLYLNETRRLVEGEYSNILGLVAVIDALKKDTEFTQQFLTNLRKKSSSWWPF